MIFRNGIKKRRTLIDELRDIITVTDEGEKSGGLLEGLSFCITGSLSRPRKEIAEEIKNVGGKVVSSVSGNLDYLVAGESAGSKLTKAQNLGVKILSEKDLLNLVNKSGMDEISSPRTGTLDDWI